MADISILFAREDRAIVDRLTAALKRDGLRVGAFVELDAAPGADASCRRAREVTACAVFIWSRATTARDGARFDRVLRCGFKALLPIAVEGVCPPPDYLDIPGVDLSNWTGEADDPQWLYFIEMLGEKGARAPRLRTKSGHGAGRTGMIPTRGQMVVAVVTVLLAVGLWSYFTAPRSGDGDGPAGAFRSHNDDPPLSGKGGQTQTPEDTGVSAGPCRAQIWQKDLGNRMTYIASFCQWGVAYAKWHRKVDTCYAFSYPVRRIKGPGSPSARRPYFAVADHLQSESFKVPSIDLGYAAGPDLRAFLLVGSKMFDLRVQGTTAWFSDRAAELDFIEAARGETSARLKVLAGRSVYSEDIFTLHGFGEAVDALYRLCTAKL